MKTINLIQRLRTGFGVLCLVAIAGAGLVASEGWQAVTQQRRAESLHAQVVMSAERMRHATLEMSYALRGVLLDPQSQTERNRKREADTDMAHLIGELRPLLRPHPDLLRALEAVSDHDDPAVD
jgi:hypothetical protein